MIHRPAARLALLGLILITTVERAGAQQPPPTSAAVEGVVFDTVSGRPVPLAVVWIAKAGGSSLTNDAGFYRVASPRGNVRLEIRRIGYEPASVSVVVGEGTTRRSIYLRPAAVQLEAVTVTAVDDPARRIVARAIARKHELFAAVHSYSYSGAVKFVVRDLGKPQDSPESILFITETRTRSYWEQPDRYQETIVARRQSINVDAERNLISVGDIVNFNRDRIDLGKYSFVSPIADDALDHYNYRILDTLTVAGVRVFRLAIEPTSDASPSFVGMIDVADSTYDVPSIDVGIGGTAKISLLENLRYRQSLKDVGGGRWMPNDIRLTGEVHIKAPIPGLPKRIAFEHVAALDSFRFDQRNRPADLGEIRVVVDERADQADSAVWNAQSEVVQLTPAEHAAWARIDSLDRRPVTLGGRIRQGTAISLLLFTDPDFFRFNRVDGAYLGAGLTWHNIPGVRLRTKLGYATGSDRWQYQVGGEIRLSEASRLWVGALYHDETVRRPTLVSRTYNPTTRALLFRLDPLDYYREQGLTLSLHTKLVDFTRFEIQYNDQRQSSLPVVTDYSVFSVDRRQRPNLPIEDGRLRSLSASLTYDSRPLAGRKGREQQLPQLIWTRLRLSAEVAAPGLIPNDFDFRRYSAQLERRQRTLGIGLTTISAAGGFATGAVPPQRDFIVDFGTEARTFQGTGFNTLKETNFAGTRAAMIVVEHDFGRLLFAKSGVPLVRQIPFGLSINGGVFWTDFHGGIPNPQDAALNTAPGGYAEFGFGIGNLTPFLSPFNLAAHFTWQLSAYPTRRFRFGLGLTRP
ncbi:MAG: DUF5686 family protein [Gemmatimonadota bacterium]